MEMHIGKEIERKYQESGMKLAEFAKRIKTSPRNIYSIFSRSDINSAQLKKISEVLKFDFFSLYQKTLPIGVSVSEPEVNYLTKRKKVSMLVELDGLQTTLSDWIRTLEKINASL